MATAGRTVMFSAFTIALAIAGLATMRLHVLRTIAMGGIVVTLLAVLAASTLTPALLTLMGRKVLGTSPLTRVPGLGRLVRSVGDSASDHGVFSRLAEKVHAHPWLVMVATFAILAVMATPLASFSMRNNFADYIPADSQLESAYQTLQDDYPALATPSVQVVIPRSQDEAAQVVEGIAALDGVDSVRAEPLASDATMTLVNVRVSAADQTGPEVTRVVDDIRAMPEDMWVGGAAALQKDIVASLTEDAPRALVVVIAAVMILLFLMTGSLLVPIKALIINSLSLLASLGATSFFFQHGVFGLPQTTGLETFIVACMVAFGFGLAMDYEVFLLARIKEYWDAGSSNDVAVEKGLQRSGRIITSAAAIIIAVFIGFAAGEMVAIKQIGVALAIMVATDATITRLLLVPATMTLLGSWNWWAPRPLAWIAAKVGLRH